VSGWKLVTAPDPERTARSLEQARRGSLEDALTFGISDPGAFLPRKTRGPKGDREYEPLSQWTGRACALIVRDWAAHFDLSQLATEDPS
jgi:hypothetical protein